MSNHTEPNDSRYNAASRLSATNGTPVLAHMGEGGVAEFFWLSAVACLAGMFITAIPLWARIAAPVAGIAMAILGLFVERGSIQLYDNAIRISRPFRTVILDFADIVGYGYDAYSESKLHADRTRTEHVGVTLSFRDRNGVLRRFRTYEDAKKEPQLKLFPITEAMIRIISARMAEEILTKGQTDWTECLRLTSSGVAYKDDVTRQWKGLSLTALQKQDWTIDEKSRFVLVDAASGKALHRVAMTAVNFFPGLHLLFDRHAEGDGRSFARALPYLLRGKQWGV